MKLYPFLPLLHRALLAATSITTAGNQALGILMFIGAIFLVGGLLVAALLGMLGRDASHIKVALICAAVGGLAVAIVVGFFAAGGTVINLNPQQPD